MRDPARAGAPIALAALAILVAADAAAGPGTRIAGTYIIAPFIAALLTAPRTTAAVAVATAVATALSFVWNENFGDLEWVIRLIVVVVAGIAATIGARARERADTTRSRFALLAGVADVADGSLSLQTTVERLQGLLVPSFADVAVLDVVRGGEVTRLGVQVDGPYADELQRFLWAQPFGEPDEPGPRAALDTGEPVLVESVAEPLLRRMARGDDAQLDQLRRLRLGSMMAIPLRARGRTLGALTVGVRESSGRRYGPPDLEFAGVLAGRLALALDNAGLSTEMATLEAQLSAALGSLAEAVTVQSADGGGLVYANDAAAAMMGFPDGPTLAATPPQQIVDLFESFNEDGTPLRVDQLPGRRVLLGEEARPHLVRAVNRETGEERWRIIKASPVHDGDGRLRFAVNVIEDITEVKRAELTQRLLADAGRTLSSSLDYELTLQRLADLAVPQLADWCGVNLPDPLTHTMRQVAVAHVDPAKVALAQTLAREYPTDLDAPEGTTAAAARGRATVVNEITDEMLVAAARDERHLELIRGLGMRAVMIVPIVARDRPIGALAFVSAESGRTFTDADFELAMELGRRAGTAVENARLYRERTRIAQTLQAGLLPPRLPDMGRWIPASLYRPAGEANWVGGDFYDAFPTRDGWMVLVGDVAGRGAPAAALTALCRYTVRTAARLLDSPLAALTQLNQELATRDEMSLCSLACALLTEREGGAEVTVVCAGHPLPLRIRAGEVEELGGFGPMLGAFADSQWSPQTVRVEDGDVLVLYTDGVLDTQGESERFGERRLHEALTGCSSADEAVTRIDDALMAFQHGEQDDDTAVLAVMRGIRVAAGEPPGALREALRRG